MSAVAVGAEAGVELREPSPTVLLPVGDEPDVDGVEQVVAAVEQLGSPVGGVEQGGERGHRPVVEERAADPDAVEGDGYIASPGTARPAEVLELPGIPLGVGVVAPRGLLGPELVPFGVG